MKINKAIDYAIIALRYWSENTEMGKQVCNDATATLKTLKEDETINVTLELSKEQLKKTFALADGKTESIESIMHAVFDERTEAFSVKKEALSTKGSADIIQSLITALL